MAGRTSRYGNKAIFLGLALATIYGMIAWRTHIEPHAQTWGKAFLEAQQRVAAHDETARIQVIEAFEAQYPILSDWLMQDQSDDWHRAFDAKDQSAADQRMHKVLADIGQRGGKVADLEERLQKVGLDGAARTKLYIDACERRRGLRLQGLSQDHRQLLFAQHHNFKMSFIGYTEGLSDARHERFFKPGTKLTLLTLDGLYAETKVLLDDPYGMMRDVDVRADGAKALFAWKKSDRLDDYHIYEYDLASGQLSQLTSGLGRADYEPVYLPDGDIIFASTRPEQSVPCWWTEISNLYRMNAEGRYIRRLAIDQVHTLYPQVLENGRIIYTRWDYSDRGQNYPHPLFNMNPDGTDQRAFYGANSWFPTSLLHARSIPGSHRVMAIAAGHHTRQHGKLVILDTDEGRDEGKGMHFIAPKRQVPYERVDVAQQTGDQFRYPYPLNESEFLVSFLPERAGEKYPKYADDAVYGLYWMDVDGNRELLYLDHEISVGRMVPLRKPNGPQVVPDTVDYQQKTGYYYVHDVYEGIGLEGIARGSAKKIRVVRLNYRAAGVGQSRNEGEGGRSLNSSPVAIGNGSWDIKEILGDVDIHADGSALFEVPAMESIYLQVLDKEGRVIQTTRTWDTVRPGERKGCVGCHAKENANFYPFAKENTLAWNQKPQQLQPFYGETRGFSFIKEIQPILDSKCISCHDGSQAGVMSLLGTMKSHGTLEKRTWSEAYLNLTHAKIGQRKNDTFYSGQTDHPVVNWISKMSKPTELAPYSFGAATSKMMHMLEAGHHGVELSTEELHKMYAWLDLLVPFIGEYREANDWTDAEMAYYNYYEHKRGEHYAEEVAAIEDWIASKAGPSGHDAASVGAAEGYGQLEPTAVMIDGNRLEITFSEEVMIDRLHFAAPHTAKGRSWTVMAASSAPKQSLTAAEDGKVNHVFAKPFPTQRLQIEGDMISVVKDLSIWGTALRLLPNHEAHHPYLQLADE